MKIVSNTSPLNYLVLIGQIKLLPTLFGQIIIPQAVQIELSDLAAPITVQSWIATPPDWLVIREIDRVSNKVVDTLDPGESEAILLALEINADLILLDDMKARRAAIAQDLSVAGILGILDRAATLKLIDLPVTVQRLQNTSFWINARLLQKLLDKHT